MTTAKRHQEGNPWQLIRDLERRIKNLETTPRNAVGNTVGTEVATNEGSIPIDANFHDLTTVGPTATFTTGVSNTGFSTVAVVAASNYTLNADSGGSCGISIALSIDGAVPANADIAPAEFFGLTPAATVLGTVSLVRVYSLTAGVAHSVKMKYMNLSGVGESWYNRALLVIPF